MSFSESLNDIKDEGKLRRLFELFNQIKDEGLASTASIIQGRSDPYNLGQTTATGGYTPSKPNFTMTGKKSTFLGSIGANVAGSPTTTSAKLPTQDYSQNSRSMPRAPDASKRTASRGGKGDEFSPTGAFAEAPSAPYAFDSHNSNPYQPQSRIPARPKLFENPTKKDKDRKFTQLGSDLLHSTPGGASAVHQAANASTSPYDNAEKNRMVYGQTAGKMNLSIRDITRNDNNSQNSQRSASHGPAPGKGLGLQYGGNAAIADSNNRDMAMFIHSSGAPNEDKPYWDGLKPLDRGLDQDKGTFGLL